VYCRGIYFNIHLVSVEGKNVQQGLPVLVRRVIEYLRPEVYSIWPSKCINFMLKKRTFTFFCGLALPLGLLLAPCVDTCGLINSFLTSICLHTKIFCFHFGGIFAQIKTIHSLIKFRDFAYRCGERVRVGLITAILSTTRDLTSPLPWDTHIR